MSDVDFALKMVRDQVKAKLDERSAVQKRADAVETEINAIISTSVSERRDISDAETALIAERREDAAKIQAELASVIDEHDKLEQRQHLLEDTFKAQAASRDAAARWAGAAESPESVGAPAARVKSEARTYNQGSERSGQSFFRDLYASTLWRDPQAGARLERHQQEARFEELAGYHGPESEQRAVTTTAFAGLTVPQYLTDMAAPLARAMAPTVAICNRHPLPDDGMTVNISRITTGTGVAVQATENAATQNTDIDDTLLTVNVRTYAGQQDLSRQALERGTGVDAIVAQDLTRAYWTTVDSAIINADGTGGTHLGIRSTAGIGTVTYTDASPTGPEFYKTLPEAISAVQSAVFMGATHFIMHPRRFWWTAASISSSFPLLNAPMVDSVQAGNIGSTEYLATSRNILGTQVVVDGNMSTALGAGTEDVVLTVTADELHFWDDGVQFIRAEQTAAGNLTVKFVLYGYSAFTAGRYPAAHAVTSGTGLIAPVFSTA